MTNAEEPQLHLNQNTDFQALSSIPGQTSITSEENVPTSDWQVRAKVTRDSVRTLSCCDV